MAPLLIVLVLYISATLPAAAVPANAYRYQEQYTKSTDASQTSMHTATSVDEQGWTLGLFPHQKAKANTRGGHSKIKQDIDLTLHQSAPKPGNKPTILPTGIPSCYGRVVKFTQYWISKEDTWDEYNNGVKVWLAIDKNDRLATTNNETIALVSKNTHNKCAMEGKVRVSEFTNGNVISA